MPLLNEDFYKKLDEKIDHIPTQEEAQEFVKQAFEPIQKQLNDAMRKIYTPLEEKITAYVGEVNVLLTLMNPPQDPMAIIPWVNGVVESFTARIKTIKAQVKPYLLQYQAAQETISGLPNEASQLQAHLEKRAEEKGWNIRVPQIVIPQIPPLPPIPSILL